MQETCRYKPSTMSRRFSVTAGFYRTCVIDGMMEHSPAEHVRRPKVPAESPTLGFTHLQFEALLTAARQSPSPCDFALVAMLGLLGLRIFEATGSDIGDLGEEHGHRVLRVCGKGTKIVLVPLPPAVGRAIDRAVGDRTAGRSCSTAAAPGWTGTRPPAACGDSPEPPASRITRPHPHMLSTPSLSVLPRRHEGRGFSGVTRRCLTDIRYLCVTSVTLCHVTELIDLPFGAERALSPLDGSELWVVLDPGFVMHREASDFLRALHGASRSPHTIRAYAGRVASSGWCAGQGVEWSSVSLAALARFKHFTEVTPGRGGRPRSGATVNATLTAVCEFLRFCARAGLIDMAVAEQLSEPRWLRFTPPGFDAGESGQFRTVRARALKARAQTPFPEALTGEQAEAVLACCRRPVTSSW